MDDYTQEQRQCYGPYQAGNGVAAHADPLAAYLDLSHLLDGDPQGFVARMRGGDPRDRYEAVKRVEAAARQVFGLAPFDPQTGGGMQLPDVLAVFKDFCVWLGALKKNGAAAAGSPSPG